MQWTIERILAELSQLDVQMESYVERCSLQPGSPMVMMEKIVNYIKANTDMMSMMMMDIAEQYPQVYEEILQEQHVGPQGFKLPGPHFHKRTNPNMN